MKIIKFVMTKTIKYMNWSITVTDQIDAYIIPEKKN